MLVDGVHCVRACRIGRRGQDIGLSAGLDDVRCVTAAGALGVIGVDGAAADRVQCRLDKTGLVERIGMDRHLDVHRIADFQRRVDRRRRRAPVLVQLQAHRASLHLFDQRRREARVAFAEKPKIHREGFGSLEHAVDMPWTRRARGRQSAGRGAGAAADHGGHARHQRLVDLLRADEVDVSVDAAGGHDHALAGDDFGPGADGDIDAGLDVRVTGLAEARDPAFLDR